uniref:Heat shock 70 kDa protein 13 n=1 Tax=Parascaris univalens TaxID=6257 RepID=A0A915AZZ1_PARUN
MSSTISVIGSALLAVLLAGYYAQKYGLPPPPPKIAAIDLGTTFSSIGIYQAVTGATDIVGDAKGKKSIPSVIAFLPNGTILVGSAAAEQQEGNPLRTVYDAKRFIGRTFEEDDPQFEMDRKRYPFSIKLNQSGAAYFEIPLNSGIRKITPEEVGGIIIAYLRKLAEVKYRVPIKQAVISVPAEFGEIQRNATRLAAEAAGMEVRRIISEPTAAALAYGLHKKKGVEYILVVDLGGGTLDVSLLWLQGSVFVTLAMAGNNRLGGQDFNDRVQKHIIEKISESFGSRLEDKEDIQQLRMAIETAKIQLTTFPSTDIDLNLRSLGRFRYRLTRSEFELLNEDLFESVVDPIEAALADADIGPGDVDEIVLVGGSTRIPRVRRVVGSYFGKAANHGIDPELAVVTGASVQAGVIGGGWPLQVAAMELPSQRRKHHVYTRGKKMNMISELPND